MPKLGRVQRGRVVLVGESNPYGGDPHYALYPHPDGCSGHRLCCLILGMRRSDYMRSFSRVNLCRGPWRVREARETALSLRGDAGARDRFVLCGSKVSGAFGVEFRPFNQTRLGQHEVLVLPHPSGLCRIWNEPDAFQKARASLLSLCPHLSGLVGVPGGDDDPDD